MSATARVPSRAAASAPARVLPQTEFEVPVVRAHLVERPALIGALRPLDITRLVLVGAPAGSWKTTLLAQWARSPGAPAVAWLALDESDDDPVLFWTCVLAALRRGAALYVSLNTVKSHVRAIYLKLSADSRAGAVARARELELI